MNMVNIIRQMLSENELKKIREVRDILEDIVETLDILLDKEALNKLREAEEDLKESRVRKWSEFLKEYRGESS